MERWRSSIHAGGRGIPRHSSYKARPDRPARKGPRPTRPRRLEPDRRQSSHPGHTCASWSARWRSATTEPCRPSSAYAPSRPPSGRPDRRRRRDSSSRDSTAKSDGRTSHHVAKSPAQSRLGSAVQSAPPMQLVTRSTTSVEWRRGVRPRGGRIMRPSLFCPNIEQPRGWGDQGCADSAPLKQQATQLRFKPFIARPFASWYRCRGDDRAGASRYRSRFIYPNSGCTLCLSRFYRGHSSLLPT